MSDDLSPVFMPFPNIIVVVCCNEVGYTLWILCTWNLKLAAYFADQTLRTHWILEQRSLEDQSKFKGEQYALEKWVLREEYSPCVSEIGFGQGWQDT